jgi:hypothetical protein
VQFRLGVYRRALKLFLRLPRYSVLSRRHAQARWVFVVGPQHSGTTLVFSMLASHSQVHPILRESYAFRSLGAPQWFQVHWGRSQLLLELCRSLSAGSPPPRVVLEKTPSHLDEMSAIARAFPAAKFVVVVRDPRDTIASVHRRGIPLSEAITAWSTSATQVNAAMHRPDTALVRLEELVASPLAVLTAVQRHLGLPVEDLTRWHEAMSAQPEASVEPSPLDHAARRRWQMRQGLLTDRAGRWAEALSEAEVDRVITEVAGVSAALGYGELSGPPPPGSTDAQRSGR